jgi:transposase
MPAPHPPEFRRRAVELARQKTAPVAQIAKDLGISESCLRNWMARADIEEGKKEGLTSSERKELAQLRRDKRRLETENEILRRAAALFAKEISPKWASGWSVTLPLTACPSRWPAGCWVCPPRGFTNGGAESPRPGRWPTSS